MSQDEAARRIAELEEALRREQAEKAMYKEATFALLSQLVSYVPVTEAELEMMLNDTSGTPILDIVAELERSGS